MSFVSKILQHTGPLERRAVHEDMETLIQKQRELHFEVHQLAENKFSQFHPSLSESEKLKQRVEDVKTNISGLEKKINCEIKGQLSLSTSEFQNLTKQLSESKAVGEALDYLADIYNMYEGSVEALNTRKYSEAVIALNKIDILLKQPLCKQEDKIQICATMKNEVFVQRLKVEQDMAEMWADCIKWNIPKAQQSDSHTSEDQSSTSVSITVGKEGFDGSVVQELVEGLQMTNLLNLRMKTFSERFQKFIIPLIIEPSEVEVTMKSSNSLNTLTIAIAPDHSSKSNRGKQSQHKAKSKQKSISEEKLYISVFDRLVSVLAYLHQMMFGVEYAKKDDSSFVEGTLMSLLGEETSEQLLDILQKDILAKAIPTSAKDLAGFESVKSATSDLQEKLVSLGYLSSNSHVLKESVENVNLLFSNKKCALILEEARDLMTSDLLNQTVPVNDSTPVDDLPALSPSQATDKGKKPEDLSDKLLSSGTFKMPHCHISKNITLLMQLAYNTLQEASESSPESATQMYFAVHNMFELFIHVVPTHHRQNIEKLPQMSAIHHNNCMYITHHLMTLGHQFALALPASESVTFVPLIQHIRENGWDFFLAQVKRQKEILLECVEEAGGFLSLEEDENREKCERSIKQVLHQLKHLYKVWQPVLPDNLYQKAMGKLIQAVVERITDCITSVEDITKDACVILTNLFVPLEEESAIVMGVSAAMLPCHIQNWPRLTNIKTVFNANLMTIDNLWADGKGPLALTFTAIEMKQMIRALFQNTDRRAELLSRIK